MEDYSVNLLCLSQAGYKLFKHVKRLFWGKVKVELLEWDQADRAGSHPGRDCEPLLVWLLLPDISRLTCRSIF